LVVSLLSIVVLILKVESLKFWTPQKVDATIREETFSPLFAYQMYHKFAILIMTLAKGVNQGQDQ
jgi:hypothetical protein